ncbi:MAG: single-stranded DNA-binding protein [Treponema sp.]|jgi:hypothetical protein|nr:single-stranded DNA-binding protein [Treponema sp.]
MKGKFLTVAVSEAEYIRIQTSAGKQGQSISSYTREKLGIEDGGAGVLLDEMIRRASRYALNTTFPLRSLFSDEEWEGYRNIKTHAGRRFYALVKAGQLEGVAIKGFDSERTMTYARTGKVVSVSDDIPSISAEGEFDEIIKQEINGARDSFLAACADLWEQFFNPHKAA